MMKEKKEDRRSLGKEMNWNDVMVDVYLMKNTV